MAASNSASTDDSDLQQMQYKVLLLGDGAVGFVAQLEVCVLCAMMLTAVVLRLVGWSCSRARTHNLAARRP